MIILYYILGWYLIGLIAGVLGTKASAKHVRIKDLPFIFGVALFGPILILIFPVVLFIEIWINFADTNPLRKLTEDFRKNKDKILW